MKKKRVEDDHCAKHEYILGHDGPLYSNIVHTK